MLWIYENRNKNNEMALNAECQRCIFIDYMQIWTMKYTTKCFDFTEVLINWEKMLVDMPWWWHCPRMKIRWEWMKRGWKKYVVLTTFEEILVLLHSAQYLIKVNASNKNDHWFQQNISVRSLKVHKRKRPFS